MVDHYIDSKGKHRVKGGAGLKGSQHYPRPQLGCCWVHLNLREVWASSCSIADQPMGEEPEGGQSLSASSGPETSKGKAFDA